MEEEKRSPLKKYDKTESIKTYHVGRSITEIIKRDKVLPASIDFDIRKSNTYIKEPGSKDYDALNEYHLKNLYKEEYLLAEELQITQEHIIKFKPMVKDPDFAPIVAVSTDPNKTIAKAIIKKNSVLKKKDLGKKLEEYLNKVKARNNILIGVIDKDLKNGIAKLVEIIESDGKLQEDFPIWLARWKKPILPVDDKLILKYKTKNKKELGENDKVDYAARDFIIGVSRGEELVEYIKPKKGKVGRGFNGKFIPVNEPSIEHVPSFNPDDSSVEVKEDDDKKIYIAKHEGFVHIDKGLLRVDTEMKLKNINLKDTGHVKPGIDSQVKIVVETKNAAEDAVGPDMQIEATEILIQGSVGPEAILKGKKVVIHGQTHSTTKIYADELEINVLKGTAYTDMATIKSFENARAYGCLIKIDKLFGGHVFGKRIEIEEVRAPSEVRAASCIHINKISSGDSRFYIDQMAVLSAKQEIEDCKQKIKDGNKYLKEGTEEMIKVSKYIRDNKDSFKQLKESIMAAKAKGDAPKPAFVKMFKEYLAKLKSLDEIQKKLEQSEVDIESSHKILQNFDKLMKRTYIHNSDLKWKGRNEVHFIYHGKVFTAEKVIDSLPSVEVVAVKDRKDAGLAVVVGIEDDFPNIDITITPDFNFPCSPLEVPEEEKTQEQIDQEKNQQPKEKEPSKEKESPKKSEETKEKKQPKE